jgi:hypothetical protein
MKSVNVFIFLASLPSRYQRQGCGSAHEAGRSRLGEKRANSDEHHAQQDRREIGQQKQG